MYQPLPHLSLDPLDTTWKQIAGGDSLAHLFPVEPHVLQTWSIPFKGDPPTPVLSAGERGGGTGGKALHWIKGRGSRAVGRVLTVLFCFYL